MKPEKKNKLDVMDILTFIGLGVFGVGLWLVSPAYSLMAIGAAVFLIGMIGSRS